MKLCAVMIGCKGGVLFGTHVPVRNVLISKSFDIYQNMSVCLGLTTVALVGRVDHFLSVMPA